MTVLKLFAILTFVYVVIETKDEFSFDDITAFVGEKFIYQIGSEEFLAVYKIYRIVERGQKKLPGWLTFDSNSSMLIGYPKTEDIGMYTLRLRAQCLDADINQCQDRLSRMFHIYVNEPLISAESRVSPDESPRLRTSIDHLEVIVGRYYEFRIPEDTFTDKEDGNTRNLSLRISLTYSKPIPKDAWLMFNETSQILYGIPLKSDVKRSDSVSEFTLIAKDSEGQVAKDAISVTYKYETNVNHRISVNLNGSYDQFLADRRNLIYFAQGIADFNEDKSLEFLSFSQIEKGSVVVVWSNNSLFGTTCFKNKIDELYGRIADENGTISDQFLALFTDIQPISTKLEYLGVCLLALTSSAPPTRSPVSETDKKIWLEVLLPALIAILVVVIIALLLLICCRHRRPRKDMKDSDKPAFLEDRRPIIFPEELEMVDPSLKPKTPLVLPSDYLTEVPPAVPPHGQSAPAYHMPMVDDDMFPEDEDAPPPPHHREHLQHSDPPPYRLPPPYYNPHRIA